MKKNIFVIGLGKFGTALAMSLAENDCDVTVIDHDEDVVNSLADYVTNAIIGDPTNEQVLKSSGVDQCDCAVVCTAVNMNDSILITLILKEMNVKKIIARALSERHKTVLERIGADIIVQPEKDMGNKLAQILSSKNLIDYFDFEEGYTIAELPVFRSWIGKTILELSIRKRYKATIIVVKSQKGVVTISPGPDFMFSEGDSITIIGEREQIEKITD